LSYNEHGKDGVEKSPMTERRTLLLASWILRVLVGFAFLTIGAAKLTGTLHTVETFRAFGWGQWFRYLTGLVDATGALLLFVPRWTYYGALVLAFTIGLGSVLSFLRLHDSLIPPLALTFMAGALAWLTRPGESELRSNTQVQPLL
jgi:putative oxidoreductase